MATHKGTKTLETARLILRPAQEEDAPAAYQNWTADPAVTKYLTWTPHQSVDVTRRVLKGWAAGYVNPRFYQWMIVPKDGMDRPIGTISAKNLEENTEAVEIGYCIGQAWWGQGIMTEALGAVMDYLFGEVRLTRIEAKHHVDNPASGKVMKKCGMRYEGTRRAYARCNAGVGDMACYGILRDDLRPVEHYMSDYIPTDDSSLVQEIYRRYEEDKRFSTPAARVEFLTTVRCVEEYLTPQAKILDVGAGTGAYSLYFASKGYQVCAVELARQNIEVFRKKMEEDAVVDLLEGNAMDLSHYPDHAFDAVLLLGPLYHLHKEEDKLRCIEEAKRVCKPEGKIFFAFIANDPVIMTMQQENPRYLLTGAYNKDTFRLEDFPFVFHTPAQCRALLEKGSITLLRQIASDGISELLKESVNAMDDETYAQYLRYHAYLCEKPECLGLSSHLLFVGR